MTEPIAIRCIKLTSGEFQSISIVLSTSFDEHGAQVKKLKDVMAAKHSIQFNSIKDEVIAHADYSLTNELKRIR